MQLRNLVEMEGTCQPVLSLIVLAALLLPLYHNVNAFCIDVPLRKSPSESGEREFTVIIYEMKGCSCAYQVRAII